MLGDNLEKEGYTKLCSWLRSLGTTVQPGNPLSQKGYRYAQGEVLVAVYLEVEAEFCTALQYELEGREDVG